MTPRIHIAGRRITRGAEGPDGYGVWGARETACGVPWRGPGTVEPETTTDPDAVTCERCLHSWWRPIDIARDEWPALRWRLSRHSSAVLVGHQRGHSRVIVWRSRGGWRAGRRDGLDVCRPTVRAALRALRASEVSP